MNADQIWGFVRTILAFGGGYAVSKGYIDNDTMTALIGGLGTIFIAGWSWWSKKKETAA